MGPAQRSKLKKLPSKDVSHVVKFDGTNIPFWKFQIFLAFEQHNLLKIVIEDETKPSLVNAVDAQGVSHSNEALGAGPVAIKIK